MPRKPEIFKSLKQLNEEARRYEKEHPFSTWFAQTVHYPIVRYLRALKNIPTEIKWFLQRGKRGWADCDVWSIDWYLSNIIPPMVRKLRGRLYGHPCGLTLITWRKVLEIIADGFELTRKIQNYQNITYKERCKIKRTFTLFEKYYYNLWD